MTDLGKLIERLKAATDWRQVPGWPYEASDTGVLRSMRSGKPIAPTLSHSGYERCTFQVNKQRKDVRVHRAVAEAWIGPIGEGLVVNHRDGNKRNNAPSNLEIVTQSENQHHAVANGLMASGARNGTHTKPETRVRGSKNGSSKLSEADIPVIRVQIAEGRPPLRIAEQFGVTRQVIDQIRKGIAWKHA